MSAPVSETIFELLEARDTPRCMFLSHRESGLRAILVLDDMTLGPAAGGIRTRAYSGVAAAMEDAAGLARAMTIKNALAGVDAGGGKMVVMDHPGLDRRGAFLRLGELVEELSGRFVTGGDLGTTVADLEVMASRCGHVHTRLPRLADSVARGVLACARACAQVAGKASLAGLRVAVQGVGEVGSAVARRFHAAGAELVIADVDAGRAEALERELAARVVAPEQVLVADVDIVCPCAVGGVITVPVATAMSAWAVCGAANLVLAGPEAEALLRDRGILYVPDVVASAGAVADGLGETLMGLSDRGELIDGLGQVALSLLEDSRRTGRLTSELAVERARARIRAARQIGV